MKLPTLDIIMISIPEFVPIISQENAALFDEIAHLEEKFVRAKEERRYIHAQLSLLQNIPDWKWKFTLLNHVIFKRCCTENQRSCSVFFPQKKLILLFCKDVLKWIKVTVKTFVMLQTISI